MSQAETLCFQHQNSTTIDPSSQCGLPAGRSTFSGAAQWALDVIVIPFSHPSPVSTSFISRLVLSRALVLRLLLIFNLCHLLFNLNLLSLPNQSAHSVLFISSTCDPSPIQTAAGLRFHACGVTNHPFVEHSATPSASCLIRSLSARSEHSLLDPSILQHLLAVDL